MEKTLPDELKTEILLRLSGKSLLRFKSVCRNWHSFIASPTFIDRYSHFSHVKDSDKVLCVRIDPINKTNVISLVNRQTNQKIKDLQWPPFLDDGVHNTDALDRVINVFGPVNGIYCIFNRSVERWIGTLVLWNPATGEYKHIIPTVFYPFSPEFLGGKWFTHWYYEPKKPMGMYIGFGLGNKTNDFKVVVICYYVAFFGDDDDRWHVKVYSLSTDSWRTIHAARDDVIPLFQGMEAYFHLYSYPENVHSHLNGVFHWSTGCEDILAFDIDDELFHLIKGPPLRPYHHPYQSVWVVKETLAMLYSTYNREENIPCGAFVWMMMEYGVRDSWAKMYSFGPVPGLAVIGIPNDDQIFFSSDDGQILSSDLEHEEFKKYDIYGVRESRSHPNNSGSLGVLKYVESFVVLNRIHQ